MKKFLLLPLFLIVLVAVGGFWFYQNAKPVAKEKNFKDFLIVKGLGANQVGNKLQKEGLIRSSLAFKIYVQAGGAAAKIQAGEYRLSPDMSLFEIVERLLQGPQEIWVTIPEGLRKEEVAERFAKALGKDKAFILDFLANADEGYLFPDTYLFSKTASASAIIGKLRATFAARTSGLGLSHDQVILASLIEREARADEDRPIIAGILLNRLRVGMALQVDATLQYIKGNWLPVSPADKSLDSPYNTYKFRGLPPGPIANPGLSSLKAAKEPAVTDYFYYLHDPQGKVYYARTLAEHNENIRRYLTD